MLRPLLPFAIATILSPGLSAAEIGDVVWIDVNRNGVQDKGDRTQEGIGLKLYFDKNGDGFPERLLSRTTSDSKGRYAFKDLKPGLYSVGLEMKGLPDEIWEATRLHVGDSAKDNDLDRNSLRTRPIQVKAGDGKLDSVADVGLVEGSTEVEYLGQEKYVSLTGLQVDCDIYLYKGMKLRFPSHHGRLKPEVIKQWMQWLKLTDSIQQQLMVSEAFLDGGMAREMGRGNLDGTVGHRPLAYAGGTYASTPRSEGDDVGKVLLDDPDDFHRHWTLIYEMGRVHPGPWHFRATWPPYTFMNAHFQTAIVLHEIGGLEAMKVANPYNGLAYQMNIDGLRFWEKSDKKFAETFQPDFADRGFAFEDGDKKVHLWGGTININILFHIYLEDGFEKVVEVLQNMAQKQRLVSTAEQAGLDLSEAINEATDGKYAKKLIEEWGMPDPADYAFRTLGRDTGKLVEKDEYLWDFIPFNSDDVAEGYSPLTEKSTKGYVRWASAPDWATRSHNDSTPARDQTVVGVGYNGVDLDGPNTYADYRRYVDRKPEPTLKETRAVGKLNAEESDNAKDNYIARWSGRLQVPMSGSYKFAMEPDDWAMLVIDGDLVAVSRNRRNEFTLELERGDHEFELAFGELGGAARLGFDFDSKLKFTGAPGERLPGFERYDNANLEGGQPITKGTFTLRHELRPAVWQVTVGFSNLAETHGVGISAEGKDAKTGIVLPQHKLHEETFEVEVRDGTLDLSFWNESSAFNSVGLSSLRIKRLRDLPK